MDSDSDNSVSNTTESNRPCFLQRSVHFSLRHIFRQDKFSPGYYRRHSTQCHPRPLLQFPRATMKKTTGLPAAAKILQPHLFFASFFQNLQPFHRVQRLNHHIRHFQGSPQHIHHTMPHNRPQNTQSQNKFDQLVISLSSQHPVQHCRSEYICSYQAILRQQIAETVSGFIDKEPRYVPNNTMLTNAAIHRTNLVFLLAFTDTNSFVSSQIHSLFVFSSSKYNESCISKNIILRLL